MTENKENPPPATNNAGNKVGGVSVANSAVLAGETLGDILDIKKAKFAGHEDAVVIPTRNQDLSSRYGSAILNVLREIGVKEPSLVSDFSREGFPISGVQVNSEDMRKIEANMGTIVRLDPPIQR